MEDTPNYGKVYHVGTRDEAMEMAKRENMLVFMPHPALEGSTGYPDAVRPMRTSFTRELSRDRVPLGDGR